MRINVEERDHAGGWTRHKGKLGGMNIDLHVHSNASDGTDNPAALPSLARAAGLSVFALTDHDTVAGWAASEAAAMRAGVTLVRGIEMTAHILVNPREHPQGKERVSVHILGYLFNPNHRDIRRHIATMKASREERAKEIVARVSRDYPLSWEAVQEQCEPGVPIGRPHIADALVAAGVADDRSAVFRTILSADSPYYVPALSPLAAAAVQWIVAAGGKAVLAHPKAASRGNYVPDSAFGPLRDAGLFGVEVYHRDNPEPERVALHQLAADLGLRICGSSDYHGQGKPNRMGENLTSEQVYAELIDGVFLPVVAPK